jgi:hypothetical protein
MTPAAPPISAAPEQEHYQNDNQNQFHGIFSIEDVVARSFTRDAKH